MNNNTTSTTAQENTAIVATNNAIVPVSQPTIQKTEPIVLAPEKKKHRNVEHCKVDFQKKKIILTKEFAKQASIINTPEFNRLSELCQAYPHLKVITRKAKKSTTRPSMKGLTKDFMETHIAILHPNDWTLYQRQLANSKAFKSPYMYMRKWFIERYPNWTDYVIQSDAAANA